MSEMFLLRPRTAEKRFGSPSYSAGNEADDVNPCGISEQVICIQRILEVCS